MSAETIENHGQPEHPEAAGSLALSTVVAPVEELPVPPVFRLERVTGDTSIRARSLTATLIKEKFQSVTGPSADERLSQRQRARETSVRLMFKAFGQLRKDPAAEAEFSKLYRETENQIATAASGERAALWERIGDLWDANVDHPAMQTLDSLRSMSSVNQEDILNMRRTALLLIADYTN